MTCNCGSKNKTKAYTFTAPDGSSKTFGTEVEANAARIRAGGGTVEPKK